MTLNPKAKVMRLEARNQYHSLCSRHRSSADGVVALGDTVDMVAAWRRAQEGPGVEEGEADELLSRRKTAREGVPLTRHTLSS